MARQPLIMVLALAVAACEGSGSTSSLSAAQAAELRRRHDAGTQPSADAGMVAPDAGSPDAGTTAPDAGTPPGGGGSAPPTPCLGSELLSSLGKDRLLVGMSGSDAAAAAAPYDVRYQYIAGKIPDGGGACSRCDTGCSTAGTSCANSAGCAWWGCWQWDQVAPGDYARGFQVRAASRDEIPMFTYYVLLQASGVPEGTAEVTQAANDRAFMSRYLADWRFLLQQVGSKVAFLHVEPDFWGYAGILASQRGWPSCSGIPAAVASANPRDCGGQPNTLQGLGRCMIAMARAYAPNAKVGLHASMWGTAYDVSTNASASFDVATEGRKLGTFLASCGAADGDFIVADMSDRDAGTNGRWLDATNARLPDFTQLWTWSTAVTEALGKPLLWWQVPVGNQGLAPANRDNRVDYLLTHLGELASSHAIGAAFGSGADGNASPDSDSGNLAARTNALRAAGGQPVCR